MSETHFDAIVIGGGVYGSVLALELKKKRERVLLLEREASLLTRASYANQARIHHGYHYPRSVLTALRSRVNFPRFVADFRECVHDRFTKVYAIARRFSNVTAQQFRTFCERIGAPLWPAPKEILQLFDRDLVEEAFLAEEWAFDAQRLAERLRSDLDRVGVQVELSSDVIDLSPKDRGVRVTWQNATKTHEGTAPRVLNCTYSRLNQLLVRAGAAPLPLKHELTELALVEVPDPLKELGITVMCGPFFSLMPFPSTGQHTLSHVRYTPHGEWADQGAEHYRDPYEVLRRTSRNSTFDYMLQDARRYLPALSGCVHVGSLFEVKTVLMESEADDSRPILMRTCPELPGLVSVMGSKVDNVYDAGESLE